VIWRLAHGREVALDRPLIFGILNATPDSFSDGGRYFTPGAALARAEEILAEGGDVIDLGGESTRPGATPVSPEEELSRIVPLVGEISSRWPDALISVDTVKAAVAAAALDEGAHIVNDVSAFRLDPSMGQICSSRGAGVVLMHSRGDVASMAGYSAAVYGDDPADEILAELDDSVAGAIAAGVGADSIAVDPGIGFSKRPEHSLAAFRAIAPLAARGRPVMVGASRKRFIGEITGVGPADERIFGSVGASVAALALGAGIFRVHDVREHRHALDVAAAIVGER
jgi:dihydropteroate synthase